MNPESPRLPTPPGSPAARRVKPRRRAGVALATLALGLTLLPAAVTAQEPGAADIPALKAEIAQAKKAVAKAENDLRRNDSLAADEADRAAKTKARLQKEKERREQETQSLQSRLDETRSKIAAEKSKTAAARNAVDEMAAREKHLLQVLAAWTDSLIVRLDRLPPYDLESRRDRATALKRDLEAGTATPDEALGRLAAILKDEIKSGDEISLLNRPLTLKTGEVINAQILKLGNLGLVYADDQAEVFGALERGADGTYAWREDLSLGEKSAVKKAIEVKAARMAPQLVTLPLPLRLDGSAAPGGEK